MPKYSVKKPFTILVAVILVLVLGFVSLTGIQTDLLPAMNLPYLMVITTTPRQPRAGRGRRDQAAGKCTFDAERRQKRDEPEQ